MHHAKLSILENVEQDEYGLFPDLKPHCLFKTTVTYKDTECELQIGCSPGIFSFNRQKWQKFFNRIKIKLLYLLFVRHYWIKSLDEGFYSCTQPILNRLKFIAENFDPEKSALTIKTKMHVTPVLKEIDQVESPLQLELAAILCERCYVIVKFI